MHENSDNITEINLPNLPVGIYNCELLSADNNRRVIRFVHYAFLYLLRMHPIFPQGIVR